MFYFGENQPRRGDFRPEVHDSDGLLVESGSGEWLWRPLQHPTRTIATSFAMNSLRGFGLMQRDRAFASYEDVETRYDRRPSAWIRPVGDWGPGRVELLQFPIPDETHDNVVAYWVPARAAGAGQAAGICLRDQLAGRQAATAARQLGHANQARHGLVAPRHNGAGESGAVRRRLRRPRAGGAACRMPRSARW